MAAAQGQAQGGEAPPDAYQQQQYPQEGAAQQPYAQEGADQQAYPQQGADQQAYPQQGADQQPQQGADQQSYPQDGGEQQYAPQDGDQAYPPGPYPEGDPPQQYTPHGPEPQPYPPEGAPQQPYPPEGTDQPPYPPPSEGADQQQYPAEGGAQQQYPEEEQGQEQYTGGQFPQEFPTQEYADPNQMLDSNYYYSASGQDAPGEDEEEEEEEEEEEYEEQPSFPMPQYVQPRMADTDLKICDKYFVKPGEWRVTDSGTLISGAQYKPRTLEEHVKDEILTPLLGLVVGKKGDSELSFFQELVDHCSIDTLQKDDEEVSEEEDAFESYDSEYLKAHLGVPLALALAEIVARKPSDPIHFLGHWLYKWNYNQENRRAETSKLNAVAREKARIAEAKAEKRREAEKLAAHAMDTLLSSLPAEEPLGYPQRIDEEYGEEQLFEPYYQGEGAPEEFEEQY